MIALFARFKYVPLYKAKKTQRSGLEEDQCETTAVSNKDGTVAPYIPNLE